jgi:hypothetical protein
MELAAMTSEDHPGVTAEPVEAAAEAATGPTVELDLPEIRFMEKKRIGMRFCVLAPARKVVVERVSSIRISAKRDVEVHHLASGENIVIADKKLNSIPADVAGLLLREAGRKDRWQWHSVLSTFKARFEACPPSALLRQIEALHEQRMAVSS